MAAALVPGEKDMDEARRKFGGGTSPGRRSSFSSSKSVSTLPTVFDDSFRGAGQKAGIEVWRIEQLKCIKKLNQPNAKDTPPNCGQLAHSGKLCSGDSYIFLHTKKKNATFERKIYYWRGKDSTQDEYGCMAYKTVELDESLGGEPSQHREMQGHETAAFKALFKSLSYIDGGVATGFKSAAEATKHKNRLLHVKGKRNVTVSQVELHPKSMNEGDVFILDIGATIYQWNGKTASRIEKTKAMDVTRKIRDEERSGKAKVVIVEQGNAATRDQDKAFWADMGHEKPTQISKGTDDAEHEAAVAKMVKLYHLSDAGGKMEIKEIPERPLKNDMLDTKDAYILHTGAGGIFAWVGKGASKAEKIQAMEQADKFLKDHKLPEWTPISRIVEGGETPLFKQVFKDWPEPVVMPGAAPSGIRRSKFQKKTFDPSALHAKKAREEARLPAEMPGSGETEIWRIENIKDLAPVDKKEYGQFYAGDSYVILYKYKEPGGRDQAFIYFWQGLKSTQDEKAASAIQAKELDDKMGGYPVQVRVVQNKEPPHFMKIFEKSLVIHAGGIGSGFKNVDQADEYDTDGVRLFHVRGTNEWNTRAVQVEEVAASLNTTDAFIYETPEQLFVWSGKGANGDEREFAKNMASKIHGLASKSKTAELIPEGSEPPLFWKYLGVKDWENVTEANRPSYSAISYEETAIQMREPRLFQVSDARGYLWAEEIFDYDQEDLIVEDCMILDTYAEVYVWLGDEARKEEKTGAMDMAKKYVEGNPERSVDDTTFLVVKQGKEPPSFTMHFIAWDRDKWAGGKTYEQMVEEMLASNPDPDAVKAGLTESLDTAVAAHAVGGTKYPYADLSHADWISKCPNVDPKHREQHLSEEEFGQHFKDPKSGEPMTIAAFNSLPKWKQSGLKKKARLF